MGTLFVIESHFKVTFKEIKCFFAGISQSLKKKISYQKYAAMIKKKKQLKNCTIWKPYGFLGKVFKII